MKDGLEMENEFITNMDNIDDEGEQIMECRRHFFEENGFFSCFDVLQLNVKNCKQYD